MRKVVIAGGSAAGLSAARELRRSGFEGTIQLVEQEAGLPYRRPEVSKGILDGTLIRDTIAVPWPDDLGIERLAEVRIRTADLSARTLTAEAGSSTITLPFDGLVIATGAVARPSPFPAELRGLHTLRNVGDGERMRAELVTAENVVIVGGGFIGLEVAAICRELGKTVTVLEATNVPLGRVLGDTFGKHIAGMHMDRGVRLMTGTLVTAIESGPDGAVTGVTLAGGMRIDADLLLVCIGSAPAVAWLEDCGLDLTDGVRCDSGCAVEGIDGVVAAGDVASWVNPLYGRRLRVEHWTNAVEQGMYAARRLLGSHDPAGFVSAPYFWSDQYGMRLQSVGTTVGHDEVVVLDHHGERMLVAYAAGGRLLGVAGILAGAAVTGFRRLVLQGADMATVRAKGEEIVAARVGTSS